MEDYEYQRIAKKRWGRKITWVTGNGPYAVVSHCHEVRPWNKGGEVTVTLWKSLEEAEKIKAGIDKLACGGCCSRNHEIVVLGSKKIVQKRSSTL